MQIQLALSVVCFEDAGYLCNVPEPLLAGCGYLSGYILDRRKLFAVEWRASMNISELLFCSFFHLLSDFVHSFLAVCLVQTQIILQNNQDANIPAVFLHYVRQMICFKPF